MIGTFSKVWRPQLVEKLEAVFLQEKESCTSQEFKEIISLCIKSATRGKLIRGLLVLFSAQMYGRNIDDEALNLAISMEIVQTALLVHDDVMDNDRLRRGEKSLFAYYSDNANDQSIENPDEYGKSHAIIAGDYLYFLSQSLIKNIEIVHYFSHALVKTGEGQMLDFIYGATNTERTADEILAMYTLKTAEYSVTLPLVAGAWLAGASSSEIAKLQEIGRLLGVAFQMHDDVIGLFGDEMVTGKPVGSDIREGKKTYIRSLLMSSELIGDNDLSVIKEIFKKKDISPEDMSTLKAIADQSEVSKKIHEKEQEYITNAKKLIKNLSISDGNMVALSEFADYLVSRAV